jgi:hypothetical protein
MDFSLSASNIEFLKKEISKSGLTYSHLMDELIDHVCCDVEHEMCNGLPFAKAYEVVKKKIGMEGLERIQHETLYLIDKKYRIMKNTMKTSGLLAPILLAFGALSKIQHWPWAGILLVLGFFLLSFVFLPSSIYVSYKEVSNRTGKWTHVTGFLGTFFLSVGFLFKIQHWPYAGTIITVGILLICLVFLPMVLNNRLKDKNDPVPKFIYLFAFSGLMIYLVAVLFKIMHWPFATGFLFAGCVLLVFIAFPLYVYHMYKEYQHISNGFIFTVIVLVWFVVPTALISINLSREVINNVYELNQSMGKDLEFLQESNEATISGMKDNPIAVSIAEHADKLMVFIEDMKNGIKQNEIPKSTEADRLTDMVNAFEKVTLSVSTDAAYSSIIRQTLDNPLKIKEQTHEEPAILLHNLTFFQLNVSLAQQTALRRLQQAEWETLQVLNQ